MNIKRYLKLFGAFLKYSFHAETAFRGNLIFWTLENLFWLFLALAVVELIFGQVVSLAGWDKNRILLIVFISSLFHDFCWTLIFRNLGDFSDMVRGGKLDFVLLKPVNQQFLLSFKRLEFDHYVRIILESFLIYKYTILITGSFYWLNLLIFLLVFLSGFMIFYSFYFILTTTNIWFINLANLIDFFHDLKDLGGKPVYIFNKGLLFFFSFILPVGFIATFPAEALLGQILYGKILLAPLLAGFFLFLSQKFFYFALRHYTSASS